MEEHKNTKREWKIHQSTCTFLVSRTEGRLKRQKKKNDETQHNKNIRKLNKKAMEEGRKEPNVTSLLLRSVVSSERVVKCRNQSLFVAADKNIWTDR